MSDETPPVVDPAEQRRRQAEHHAKMLDHAVRHLYGAALTMSRLTGGTIADAPRLLVAAATQGVASLIEKIVNLEKYLEATPADAPKRVELLQQLDNYAKDLSQTIVDFDAALTEALTNLRNMEAAENEPPPPAPTTH